MLTGLAAGGHCLGMCGGLQAALMPAATTGLWRLQCGRSLAYTLLGAVAGGLGAGLGSGLGAGLGNGFTAPAVNVLRLLASLMATLALLSLAARLVFRRDLLGLERLGGYFWRWLQPLARRAGEWREPWRSYALGMVWAFIPCGLVLSMAALAATTGAAWHGAFLLAAFALGTWPALLGAGAVGRLTGLATRAVPSRANTWARWALAMALVLLAAAQAAFLFAPHQGHHADDPAMPHQHHTAALSGFRDGGESLTLSVRAVRAPA
jgi:sulfite exporter TauE/SafE